MTRTVEAAELTARDIGRLCSFTVNRLSVAGVLMNMRPDTIIEHDGAGTESDVLLGPIGVVVGDGWTITVEVPLPPDHPIILEDLR